jgi:hypothetical protein
LQLDDPVLLASTPDTAAVGLGQSGPAAGPEEAVAFVAGTAFASLSDIPRFSFPMPRPCGNDGSHGWLRQRRPRGIIAPDPVSVLR